MPSGYNQPAGGQTLTTEQVETVLVNPLKARAVTLQANPRIFESQGGVPLRIPRLDAFDLADPWRAENTQIAEDDPDFGEVVLLPSTLKSLKTLHRVSNELARHSVVGITQALADALVAEVARAADRAFLVGDGTGDTIVGLAESPGVQTVPAVGTPDVDTLHDAELALLSADANPETSAWFMHPRDLVTLRKTREGAGSGTYLVQPDPTEAGRYRLLGHRVFVTTQLPTDEGAGTDESRVILADMAQVAVGVDMQPSFTVLDQTFGHWDQLALRVVCRMDIAPLNAAGVVVLEGVTA